MGLKLWLKRKLFVEDRIVFERPVDRTIYDALSEPKSGLALRNELDLGKPHAYKRLSVLRAMGLVKKEDNLFSQTEEGPSLRLKPTVWLNGLAFAGMLISIPLGDTPLTLFSLGSLFLNAVSLKDKKVKSKESTPA